MCTTVGPAAPARALPPHAVLRVGQVFDEGIAGVNPLNPQQFYNTYLSKQKIIVDADCYRTFSREKIEGTPQLLEYDHRQTDRLIDYDNYADYEASDADIESEGYFGDIHAIRRFPGAFKTRNELVDKIMSGEVIHMTRSELMMLENTYLRKVIQAASPKKVAMKFAQEKHKDWERIVTGLLAGDSIPPAIVIRSKTGNFLLGGNVRLSAGAAWGFNMPIKTVDI